MEPKTSTPAATCSTVLFMALIQVALASLDSQMEATQPMEKPLSEHIKATREVLGLSRVKAAKKWSISAATIRAWEEKKRNPSGLYLSRITQILGRLERSSRQAVSQTVGLQDG